MFSEEFLTVIVALAASQPLSAPKRVIGIVLAAAAAIFVIWSVRRDRLGTSLYKAVCDGDVHKARSLIEKGVSLGRVFDLAGNRRVTYLHAAATCGQTDVAKLLIESGTKVNARSAKGSTPLHDACQMGYARVVEVLIRAGADVNGLDDAGTTPLHYAVIGAALHPAFIRHISELRERHPDSPRARSALTGISHSEVIALLLAKGADKHRRDPANRKTAAEIAAEAGLTEMQRLLT